MIAAEEDTKVAVTLSNSTTYDDDDDNDDEDDEEERHLADEDLEIKECSWEKTSTSSHLRLILILYIPT